MTLRRDTLLYLGERDVARALEATEIVETVAAALAAHARGETILPMEAYLAWEHHGEGLRSLSMPGLVHDCAGVKVINANPANPERGLTRASGLTILFDQETGRPTCILEAARISCLRTAAVTAIAADLLGAHPIERLALLGAGALARCHLEFLPGRLRELREIRLYDSDRRRALALAANAANKRLAVCGSAEEAMRDADLVVPVTTTSDGYIHYHWLKPGALLVNVSLDDPLPEVVLRADKLFVDDWTLVAHDDRRLLGRMLRAGHIRGPHDSDQHGRPIDGELGELLIGTRPGRRRPDEVILLNPFGLAIEDLALAQHVHRYATEHGLGAPLAR